MGFSSGWSLVEVMNDEVLKSWVPEVLKVSTVTHQWGCHTRGMDTVEQREGWTQWSREREREKKGGVLNDNSADTQVWHTLHRDNWTPCCYASDCVSCLRMSVCKWKGGVGWSASLLGLHAHFGVCWCACVCVSVCWCMCVSKSLSNMTHAECVGNLHGEASDIWQTLHEIA